MGISFSGLKEVMEKRSVAGADIKSTPFVPVVKAPVSAPVLEKTDVGSAVHTGPYWVKEGGTYTQTHPGLMNPTEFYFWKRKQAGLSTHVVPSQQAASVAALTATFGEDWKTIPRPAVSAAEIRESAAESKAIAHRAAVGRSNVVGAHEYVAHHAEHFGTEEAASLGAGLHNIYGDEYAVLEPKEGINVVVDSGKDEVFVISDAPLGAEEKLNYARAVDKAGDVPNRVQFITDGGGGGAPTAVSSGVSGGTAIGGGMLVAVIAAVAVIWYLFSGRR